MSFAALKANRNKSNDALIEQLNKLNTNQKFSTEDNRFWKPEVDKAGNGYAVIRFLPAPEGEDFPFIRMWDHGFQGPGGWYIENSLTTIGKDDPVSEYNTKLWNSGSEALKEQARKQKRRLHYITNILVVNDPVRPENNGKVFLYKFGKKIFDKINDVMNPEFEDETPVVPFDLWEGANFKLKIRKVEGWTNYDKSEFDSVSAASEDEKELETIYNGLHKLQPFLEESNFKDYDELKKKLDRVLGLNGGTSKPDFNTAEDMAADDNDEVDMSSEALSESSGDDDDELEFFKKLAES